MRLAISLIITTGKEKRPYPKLNKVAMVAWMDKTLKCLLAIVKHHDRYRYRYHGLLS